MEQIEKKPLKTLPIADYIYNLPDEKIAKYPLSQRDNSKLLIYNNKQISDTQFTDLPNHLSSSDIILFNDSRVIQARLFFQKTTGAKIEILLLNPLTPKDYLSAFSVIGECVWECYVGNRKKWKSSTTITCQKDNFTLSATLLQTNQETASVKFSWTSNQTFGELLAYFGNLPIPPYLNRPTETIDLQRYQTVYADKEGSIAAPTAGLHFTDNILTQLKAKGIPDFRLALHVGAGTFRPVQGDDASQHAMHSEHFIVSRQLISYLANHPEKQLLCVGTTSVRAIESLYWIGVKLSIDPQAKLSLSQWEAYNLPQDISLTDAFQALLKHMDALQTDTLQADTSIMIVPGYSFRVCKKLVTNFHQPQSTLLLLIAAFVGDKWKEIYNHALTHDYRFLSYGDSSLLIP